MSNADYNIWEGKQTNVNDKEPAVVSSNTDRASFDINFKRILGLWPFVLLFALIGYSVGRIVLRYITPIYTVSTSVTIEAEESETSELEKMLLGKKKGVSLVDKISFFKSPALASNIVDTLGLHYHSESIGKFKNTDYYGIIDWRILNVVEKNDPVSLEFTIVPKSNGFQYSYEKKTGNAYWGIPFFIKNLKVVISKQRSISKGTIIKCFNNSKYNEAFALTRSLYVASVGQGNSLLIQYQDQNSDRAIDILNCLLKLQKNELEKDKSIGYSKTIDFIDQRLEPLGRDLDSIENSLAQFKIENGIVGKATSLSTGYEDQIRIAEDALTQIRNKEMALKEVEDFIYNPKQFDSDLSFVNLEGTTLNSLCTQFQQYRKDRDRLSQYAQDANPKMRMLDKNIAELRNAMNRQVANYKMNLKVLKDNNLKLITEVKAKLIDAPTIEKEFTEKNRYKAIKEALYSSLLQKREEAMMNKASVNVDNKLIYPPLKSNAVINPSKTIVLSISILVGILLPIIFGVVKEITNKKVITKKNLQSNTSIPVLAELEEVKSFKSFPFAIGGNNRSMFGEQIRSLRTNMSFYLNAEKKTNFILITSSISGEGKSFLSMNIAKSYSLQGKKVALLEFDLRRPRISHALGLVDVESGLTSFLIGKSTVDEIVHTIIRDDIEHLDYFPAGYIPPNPQELISSKYMKVLKNYLEENYDIVVLDSPPFGIVADAQILGAWADITLVITRFNLTTIDQIKEINSWNERKVFKSMAMIFNGVKTSGYFGYHYGNYYYRRKYGYGYYYGAYGYGDSSKNKANKQNT